MSVAKDEVRVEMDALRVEKNMARVEKNTLRVEKNAVRVETAERLVKSTKRSVPLDGQRVLLAGRGCELPTPQISANGARVDMDGVFVLSDAHNLRLDGRFLRQGGRRRLRAAPVASSTVVIFQKNPLVAPKNEPRSASAALHIPRTARGDRPP